MGEFLKWCFEAPIRYFQLIVLMLGFCLFFKPIQITNNTLLPTLSDNQEEEEEEGE